MTKEQLETAKAMLDAHREMIVQHSKIIDKLDQVIKNTRRDLYVWILVISLFSVMTLGTLIGLAQ